ncbi:FAR1 DNA binding domain-containing protein, partial [Cynara cardunculus var. scolymus]
MDPISFNETFVKDIFDEIGGINGKRKGFDLDREIATATNDGTTQDKCNYSARDEDGCIRQNETIPERSDSITGRVSAEFDDDDVASLSNESEDMGETSDGSKYWFPSVDVKYKPKVGDSFESVESAEKMYRKYANEAGFDIRLSNKKINKLGRITSRFYVCSKEGRPQSKYFDSLDVLPSGRTFRNSNIKRSGCGACLKIHFVKEPNQYEVYKFVEQHNHILFNKEEMRFSRFKRKLHYADHKNVFHGSSSKVGVTKSHRFMNAVKGGVIKNKMENSYDCSCNCFVRNGILCRHTLKVMLNDEVDRIPDKYILLLPVEWLPTRSRYGEVDAEKERLMSRIRNEKDILSRFVDQLEQWDSKVDSELHLQSHTEETTTSIKEFLGVSQPETVDVLPPTGIRNKGCGTGKRLINAAEKAISNGKSRRESVAYVVKWLHMIPEIRKTYSE